MEKEREPFMLDGSSILAMIEKFELQDWKFYGVIKERGFPTYYEFVRGRLLSRQPLTYEEMCGIRLAPGEHGEIADWFQGVCEEDGKYFYRHVRGY